MKTIVYALVAAILFASPLFTPVAAASSPSVQQATTICGDTYTVEPGDWLAKIARYCGTTVISMLALNPQIINPNIIYTGQVLRLDSNAPVINYPTYNYTYNPSTVYSGSARVSLSTTRAAIGDTVTVYVSGFPANSEIDYRVGQLGDTASVIYDGTVGSDGTTNQTITIPSGAAYGEYWVVQVITTSLANITSVTSRSIYIATTTSSSPYTSYYASVSLTATQAHVGDSVTVYVSGFPANAEIDYRLGKLGQDFSVVYDGTVGSNGSTSQAITIPSSAVAGEYWVVKVITTSLATVTQVDSHSIYITN